MTLKSIFFVLDKGMYSELASQGSETEQIKHSELETSPVASVVTTEPWGVGKCVKILSNKSIPVGK